MKAKLEFDLSNPKGKKKFKKAVLEFDLSQLGGKSEFRKAVMADDLSCAVWDFMEKNLREWIKYGHEFKTAVDALEGVRERLVEVLDDHGISVNDLL